MLGLTLIDGDSLGMELGVSVGSFVGAVVGAEKKINESNVLDLQIIEY